MDTLTGIYRLNCWLWSAKWVKVYPMGLLSKYSVIESSRLGHIHLHAPHSCFSTIMSILHKSYHCYSRQLSFSASDVVPLTRCQHKM